MLVILAIDQGTTGTTCLLVDDELTVRGRGYARAAAALPALGLGRARPGGDLAERARRRADAGARRRTPIDAIGITNQRETTLLWERAGRRPVAPRDRLAGPPHRRALRASCRRSCIRERTGLVPDPYFSATKLEWLLREHDAPADGLAFGTVDSWLVWKLTGGRVHATDETNASRTLLCSARRRSTGTTSCSTLFGVAAELLPEIEPSGGLVRRGASCSAATLPIAGHRRRPAGGALRQAARAGEAKATYGTGCFVLVEPAPSAPVRRRTALLDDRRAATPRAYALEGAVFVTGAAIQWLRDGLGLIDDAAETEALAASLDDNGGVYFVPAFVGLGSPHWRADARGTITGLTRGTTRAQLVRAALEATAFQTRDVLDAMPRARAAARRRRHDARTRWLMQFQADVLGIPVEVAREPEQTALGAALLALGERRPSPAGERFEPQRSVDRSGGATRSAERSSHLAIARFPVTSQTRSRRLVHPTERSTTCRYRRHWQRPRW